MSYREEHNEKKKKKICQSKIKANEVKGKKTSAGKKIA